MKKIELEDTSFRVTGLNFNLDMTFDDIEDWMLFIEKALTPAQVFSFNGDTRRFNISERRFNKAMSLFEEVKN